MKKIIKAALLFFISILILSFCCLPAFATEAERTTAWIGGHEAKVVYVTLSPTSVVCPLIPAGGVCTTDYGCYMISDSPATVVAAINGSFFNSYYRTSRPLDINTGNYAAMYGTLVVDGKMISSGSNSALGFGYDGSVHIGRVDLAATLTVNDRTFICWGVNAIYNQKKAVYALTPEMPYAVNVPVDSTIVTVNDGKVQSIEKGRSGFRPPAGGVALVFEKSYRVWDVAVGDEAVYGYTVRSGDPELWSSMRYIIGTSGMLVEDGVNVAGKNSFSESKLQPDAVDDRCFIALTGDGRLMFATVTGSFRKIADSLVAMGVSDAILLDGGASSLLYANGKYMRSPGRKLANLVAVVDPTVPPFDEPSDWALADVAEAAGLGILSEELDCNYQTAITREEFCSLIAGYIEAKTGKTLSRFCREQTGTKCSFSDTSDKTTLNIAYLGIINGYPDGTFRPDDHIIRQDAAIILERLARIMGVDLDGPSEPADEDTSTASETGDEDMSDDSGEDISGAEETSPANVSRPAKVFTDSAKISPYAVPGVDFVSGWGIMNGNTDGSFRPQANITREQAVITMMNTWRNIE